MTATSLTLDQTFISKIVEISNIHGMSIKKFKRIMKIIISDFFFSNEFFFIHYVDIGLESYEEFVSSLQGPISENIKNYLSRFNSKELQEVMTLAQIP